MLHPLVLVVDNSEDLRAVFSTILAHFGYSVLLARDGGEAIRQATDHRPNLIILDLDLPGLSGWDVVHRLKADQLTAPIPVVAVTENPESGLSAHLRAAGFSAYIAKPFPLKYLLEVVPMCLEAHRAGASWVNLPAVKL